MEEKTKKLKDLHLLLTEELISRMESGEATSAEMAVAVKFLKDNNIDAFPIDGSPLSKLAESLPFSTEKLKEAVDGTEH